MCLFVKFLRPAFRFGAPLLLLNIFLRLIQKYYFSESCTNLIFIALQNSFLHLMKKELTIKELQESIRNRELTYQIDEFYTAIAGEHKFISVVQDFYGQSTNGECSSDDELENLVLKSLPLWQSDYLDPFDTRFKHNWQRGDTRFVVPAFISKSEFKDQDIKLRIMAANIASVVNSKLKTEGEYEEYQAYQRRRPGSLSFSGDRMIAMSLSVVYKSKNDRHDSLEEYLGFYLTSEWGRQWLEQYALPTFHEIEKNIDSRFNKALEAWGKAANESYKYYPIALHYNQYCTAHKVADFLVNMFNEKRERDFQKAIASVVSTKPHVQSEIEELKRGYFSFGGSFNASLLYTTHRKAPSDDLEIDCEDFEKIVRWSSVKAAANFIYLLEDRLATGQVLKDTDITLAEFANLAFFLTEIDLFKNSESAVLHLSHFFKGVDAKGKNIELKYGTLKMMKDKSIINELKKVFAKINK